MSLRARSGQIDALWAQAPNIAMDIDGATSRLNVHDKALII